MPPLHREHHVHGTFKLENGRLTFHTGSALLAQEAQQAKAAGRDFTVCLMSADPVHDETGKVVSVELVEGVKPSQWQVIMTVLKPEDRGKKPRQPSRRR
jgi:hypothetical protein